MNGGHVSIEAKGPSKAQDEPKTAADRLGYLVEKCGGVLQAAGKALRSRCGSVHPEPPRKEQETDGRWLRREVAKLNAAIERIESGLEHGVERLEGYAGGRPAVVADGPGVLPVEGDVNCVVKSRDSEIVRAVGSARRDLELGRIAREMGDPPGASPASAVGRLETLAGGCRVRGERSRRSRRAPDRASPPKVTATLAGPGEVPGTWCPGCGPSVTVDEDGFCDACGFVAVGEEAERALSSWRRRVEARLGGELGAAGAGRLVAWELRERAVQKWERGLVLRYLAVRGPISFRELERRPPEGVSRKAARVGVQTLIGEGKLKFNRDLKLEVVQP